MQVFILGATKSGKTTLASALRTELIAAQSGLSVELYEAGAWARKEFSKTPQGKVFADELDPAFKNALTAFALRRLKEDPLYSLNRYRYWRYERDSAHVIISGVRNPDDFVGMLADDSGFNAVIWLQSENVAQGTLGLFEEGLSIIESYLGWKERIGSPVMQITVDASLIDQHPGAIATQLARQILDASQKHLRTFDA